MANRKIVGVGAFEDGKGKVPILPKAPPAVSDEAPVSKAGAKPRRGKNSGNPKKRREQHK